MITTPSDSGSTEINRSYARLHYNGAEFPRHRVVAFGKTAMLERWVKSKREWKRQRDYPGPDVYPRWKVEGRWITASLAVQQSFATGEVAGKLACHVAGAKPSEFGLGSCVLGSIDDNRKHRKRDGTSSTGHDTTPHKLSELEVLEIWRRYDQGESVRKLAVRFQVTRQAIRYRLNNRPSPGSK